jgi:anthranilate synthase/aminodeoxychorismate synthase-like glutamine amidotransferase
VPGSDLSRSIRAAGSRAATCRPRILLVDNYDSFTFNLVHYLGEAGAQVEVVRNDAATVAELVARAPDGVVISPGPGAPPGAGVSLAVVGAFAGLVPVLGVCLGHQAIGEVFGGRVVRSVEIVHGKASPIAHRGIGVFAGLPQGVAVGRYHSLIVERATLPRCLVITATSPRGEIMGLRHRTLEVEGVQFHPESVLTPCGRPLLANWLERCAVRTSPRTRRSQRQIDKELSQ